MDRTSTSRTRHPSHRLVAVAASAALGFLIWAASPTLTGCPEPWDAEGPFYSVTSVVGGSILGFLLPRHLVLLFLGAWWGQVVALAVLPGLDRGWLLLGVFTTGIGSVLVLFGSLVGRLVRSKRPRRVVGG